VVQLLTENYRGYAEMINLMSSWLMETGLAPDQVSELLKEKLRAVLMEKFSSSQADSIFAEMQSAPRWLDVMIEHPDWRALIYQARTSLCCCYLASSSFFSALGQQCGVCPRPVIGSASELLDVELCHPEDFRRWPPD